MLKHRAAVQQAKQSGKQSAQAAEVPADPMALGLQQVLACISTAAGARWRL